ncbi:MAG: hypothetical protein B7Y41_12410 [Hydrogenophilales bacterium 28-61-23]|nr:MAG: hypothetical protein B7Y41_12410 [Hydrogenophilales bacterium 28-61-23]
MEKIINSRGENTERRYVTRFIGLGFGVVITLMLALAATTLMRLDRIKENIRQIAEDHTIHAQMAHRMFDVARERTYLLFKIANTDDLFLADELVMRYRGLEREFNQARQAILKLHLVPDELALLELQRQAGEKTALYQEVVLDHVFAGRREQAGAALLKDAMPAQEVVLNAIDRIIDMQHQEVAQASKKASEHEHQAYLFLLIGTAVATLLSGWIAFYVQGHMSGLMRRLSDKSEQLRLSLRDLEFQKQALDEHAIVSITDARGHIVYVNDRFCAVSQYSRPELIGSDHHIVNSGQHPKQFFQDMWRTIASGQVWHGQVCNRRKDGSFYWVDTTIRPFIGDDGRPDRYISIRTDITTVKEAETLLKFGNEELEDMVAQRTAELAEREAVLQRITGSAQDAIVMIDHNDRVTFWNAAAERLFGYSQEEMLGQLLHPLLMPAAMKARQEAAFSHFVADGKGELVDKTTEMSARRRDGSEFPIDVSLSAVKIKGKWCGIGIARDVTSRKQAEAALQLLADTDTLTRLPNRRKFDAVLSTEVSRAQRHATPLTLVMLDIDHFKSVNDSYGHPIGDSVLIELARLVSSHIRAHDIFARWGGEEFAILATHSDGEETRHFADKLRLLVAEHTFPSVGHLTISLGLATYQSDERIEDFLARADKALYVAKSEGRNRVESL